MNNCQDFKHINICVQLGICRLQVKDRLKVQCHKIMVSTLTSIDQQHQLKQTTVLTGAECLQLDWALYREQYHGHGEYNMTW